MGNEKLEELSPSGRRKEKIKHDDVRKSRGDIMLIATPPNKTFTSPNKNQPRGPHLTAKRTTKKPIETDKTDIPGACNVSPSNSPNHCKTQEQLKTVLVECLQNLSQTRKRTTEGKDISNALTSGNSATKSQEQRSSRQEGTTPHSFLSETLARTSLLQSYLGSNSNPSREEYVSKSRNVSNSLISSDSIHHSVFLESGRERRQCILQYLSTVVLDGQVVVYVNSIPGVESLLSFLRKHGFQVNMVHPKMLMAEANWILSEFSLKKFAVLLCAEDHYHSCPAHFRWVKTIINYELPISNPVENWTIRNGIVEFSDNLPVHIYTFIKKTCPLDNELVKLLHLDSEYQEEDFFPSLTEQVYSAA